MNSSKVSIILPAKNEDENLRRLLPELTKLYPDYEIIVVDDGSVDNTVDVCKSSGVKVLSHPYSMGNGAAIKNGARSATGDILVFMDADGQHNPDDIQRLLEKMDTGYDMVIGARKSSSHASLFRRFANNFYNRISSWMTSQKIEDLTSGFRAIRTKQFGKFIHLLPNKFSYPTTITMSFFRSGFPVAYIPIIANKRGGTSHINILSDGIRFLLIIFKIGTLYSPLKLFLPISLAHFALGISYYLYTYITYGRFTNMSALLIITSILIFLIGLVSEQITALLFQQRERQ